MESMRVSESAVPTVTPHALTMTYLHATTIAQVPMLCGGALCGGSAEHPATGLGLAHPRPTFIGVDFTNARSDHGCHGDGLHDDTNALRSAFSNGSNVFLPFGTYKITDTLTLCNVTLVGEGLSAIALAAATPGCV